MEGSRYHLAACLLLAASLTPRAASAHVEPMSVPELAAASPDIVVAMVEGRQVRWNGPRTLLVTDYALRIEDRLRGGAPDRITLSVPGGSLGNVTDETCVSVELETGARYLLFLEDPARPSLSPVIGAWQGMIREIPGARGSLALIGKSREPLAVDGQPVRFQDVVATVRTLAAKALPARPAPRPPAGSLPAKAWNPLAPAVPVAGSLPRLAPPRFAAPPRPAKGAPPVVEIAGLGAPEIPQPVREAFVYYELAPLPVVVNPLPADNAYAPLDQSQMAIWNLYGDIYRVSASPTSTWAYGNGVSDIAGFPDDAQMMAQFKYGWGDIGEGVLAVSFVRRVNGVVSEADVAFNPLKLWTRDMEEGTRRGPAYPFQDVALHELGHVWGLKHPWQTQEVWWDSVMNYRSKRYYAGHLFADDTSAVRDAFPPGIKIRDGLISSYVTSYDNPEDFPTYTPSGPAVSKVRAGGTFSLVGPIKVENPGSVPLAKSQVEVYLAPSRYSFDGAILIKRVKLKGTLQAGGVQKVALGKIRVPPGAKAGAYFLAYYLRDSKDQYLENNAAWSDYDATLEVTR